MKIRNFRISLVAMVAMLLVNSISIGIPAVHAQSSSDWSDPINLSNAGSSTNPAFVVDAAGIIHAIWVDEFDGYKYVKSEDGQNWTSPETVKFPFSPKDSQPVLLTSGSGEIYALWQDTKNVLYYSKVSTAFFDNPSKWATRKKLADSVMDFDAVVSPGQILHIAYASSLGTDSHPAGVYYLQLKRDVWSSLESLYSSQYFRSMALEDMNVNLAVAEEDEVETVYVVWDDRSQKQIFLSKSIDGGKLWDGPTQIRSIEDGAAMPFNINVGAAGQNVLVLWQAGVPREQCASYSQWSGDGGQQFDAPVKMVEQVTGCADSSEFMLMNKDLSITLLDIMGEISLTAWDGSHWGKPQTQNEITTFTNPATLDTVVFGCQKLVVYHAKLFVIGCDQGDGGDVWFSSRELGTLEDWFPPSSVWIAPVELTTLDQPISELSTVADRENNIHTFWIQPAFSAENTAGADLVTATIQYAEWDGETWTDPTAIISGLDGNSIQLNAHADSLNRLLICWVDSGTGDLFFSWAGTKRARVASEWEDPVSLPTVSQLNSSPDILVDDSGRILVAYASPINEGRGIYFVESSDNGASWTQPVQIFDAVAVGWDMVDQPKISLTGDGRLHVLFKRFFMLGESPSPLGLYYSQSSNGGIVWSDPELVSDHPEPMGEIFGYDRSVLHRLWQEVQQSTLFTFHQISEDAGVTWATP
ncbi:MAG: sialidase family protein, partial [Chloroflexota bacterium]